MSFQDHFSAQAASYAQSRPHYPAALFSWLAAQCRGHALAWDAGCGNGQASIALAAHFDAVLGTDPSAAQIASATAHPGVRYAVEPAEHCSLGDASADLVTVAQAYHWFDQSRFCAEARRVLQPDGVIAIWSYAESRVDPAVDAVFDELHHVRLGDYWPAGRDHVLNRYRDLPFPFTPIAAPAFEMRSDWTLAQYLAYLRSWSASQRYLERTGRDAVSEIEATMSAAWGDPALRRIVQWPLLLLVGRC
jgi:SAM-dependent methyltransferase